VKSQVIFVPGHARCVGVLDLTIKLVSNTNYNTSMGPLVYWPTQFKCLPVTVPIWESSVKGYGDLKGGLTMGYGGTPVKKKNYAYLSGAKVGTAVVFAPYRSTRIGVFDTTTDHFRTVESSTTPDFFQMPLSTAEGEIPLLLLEHDAAHVFTC
jgi:hypothetical protein